jgi:hypothetical protein
MESATAARLVEFVDHGGTLVAVGELPARAAGGRADASSVAQLRERFDRGLATCVAEPEDLAAALAAVPAGVRAPVPTLRRDGDGATVVFVPAVFPRASAVSASHEHPMFPWLTVDIDFDPGRYAEAIEVTVAGVEGAPELWEPLSGRRRTLPFASTDDGVRVRVPFDDGPAALLVWAATGEADPPAPAPAAGAGEPQVLDGPWDVTIESTLEDAWADLDAPPVTMPVEAWAVEHCDGGTWRRVHATFGPRGEQRSPGDADWHPAIWSPSRGIHKDPIHAETLGPSGRVPEEFLRFGMVGAGEEALFRTTLHVDAPVSAHLVVGAAAAKRASLGGEPIALTGDGYLAHALVELDAGPVALDLRFVATEPVDLRAHLALVTDLEGYLRPEWLRVQGGPLRDSVVRFDHPFTLGADADSAQLLVSANVPCRVMLDGDLIRLQGGFAPYIELDRDTTRVYDLADLLDAGDHVLSFELSDLGRVRPAVLVDGVVRAGSQTVHLRSGGDWAARRDGAEAATEIRLDQRGDPAHLHLWRRPHPLPEGAWLEPGRAVAEAGARVDVRLGAQIASQRLRVLAPPGAEQMLVPLAPGCRLTRALVDGEAMAISPGAAVALPGGRPRTVELEVEPGPGLSGGALLAGPIRFAVGAGEMELGDWQERGLAGHSGGVRYRRVLDGSGSGPRRLRLGIVRGTTEVFVDGVSQGVRVCSPYDFEIDVRPGATLEILVLGTLAPHLDAVSPTHYAFAGQKRTGLFGPVTLGPAAPPSEEQT